MADLIDRGKFWDNLNDELEMGVTDAIEAVNNALDNTPTVDAVPVRHGHWIVRREGTYLQTRVYCSWCGKRSGIGGILENQLKPFCPHCGAKMDEEHENETD